ncbi:MAG: hypothetical protein AB1847_05260 [bacterium]
MKINEYKARYLRFAVLVVISVMVWIFGFQHPVFAAYIDTAHGNTSAGVNRSGHTDCPEGTVCPTGDCTHCHDAFNPNVCGIEQTMLFAGLDSPDFCMQCHTNSDSQQVGGMSGAPAGIPSVFSKTYRHNVTGYSGLHKFSPKEETRVYLSANKHVECDDCHNPHGAANNLHNELATNAGLHLAAVTNETAGGPLKGAFGVEPAAWGSSNWSGVSSWPVTSTTATKEYQICFKCHSDYNTSFSSWGGSGPQSWTNAALEFSSKNNSYHPAVQALPDTDPGNDCCSGRLPAPFTSLLIGDSGLATQAVDFSLTIDPAAGNGKTWQPGQWANWGIRVGTLTRSGSYTFNQVGKINSNTATSLSISWQGLTGLASGTDKYDVVYSIEYYAGMGAKAGVRITDTSKNFHQYLPSLVGYWVVICNGPGSSQKIATGRVVQSQPTWFEVEEWIAWQAPTGVPIGGVPPDASSKVGYYFSATGKTMMCSDCHSNNEISGTTAQGPHGSTVKWMLKGRNRAWPTLQASENGTGTGTLRKIGNTATPNHRSVKDGNPDGNGLFCLNCHSTVSFSKNKYGVQDNTNVHISHAAGWPDGPECVRCHIMVPHGAKLSRLIGDQNGTMPSRYAFNNDLSNMWVTKFWKCDDPAGYDNTPGRGNDWCSVLCHGQEYHHPSDGNGDDW